MFAVHIPSEQLHIKGNTVWTENFQPDTPIDTFVTYVEVHRMVKVASQEAVAVAVIQCLAGAIDPVDREYARWYVVEAVRRWAPIQYREFLQTHEIMTAFQDEAVEGGYNAV